MLRIKRFPSHTEQYFHGTKLTCNIMKDEAVCMNRNCGICGITREGFNENYIARNIPTWIRDVTWLLVLWCPLASLWSNDLQESVALSWSNWYHTSWFCPCTLQILRCGSTQMWVSQLKTEQVRCRMHLSTQNPIWSLNCLACNLACHLHNFCITVMLCSYLSQLVYLYMCIWASMILLFHHYFWHRKLMCWREVKIAVFPELPY